MSLRSNGTKAEQKQNIYIPFILLFIMKIQIVYPFGIVESDVSKNTWEEIKIALAICFNTLKIQEVRLIKK